VSGKVINLIGIFKLEKMLQITEAQTEPIVRLASGDGMTLVFKDAYSSAEIPRASELCE